MAEIESQRNAEFAENDANRKSKMTQMTQFVLTLTWADILRQMYLVAVTAGYSRSVVEYVFSALNRIDMCHRRKMTPCRETGLTLLHFENAIARAITFEHLKLSLAN